MAQSCAHVKQIKFTTTDTHVCEECIKLGDTWVHLRLCLECGTWAVAIHPRTSMPPSIFTVPSTRWSRSIEPGEAWIWCYVDELSPGEIET